MAHKTSLFALLLVGACSTPTPQTAEIDAPMTTPPPPPPDAFAIPGPHYQYIFDRIDLPTTVTQLTNWSVDLDGDNHLDNAFGGLFALLTSDGFSIPSKMAVAIGHGNILELIDLQAADFQNAPVVGVQVLHGADPIPAPCGPDVNCSHHLDGSGHFTIAANDPHDPALLGSIQDGVLTTTAGDFGFQISLGVEPLLDLPVTDAHLQLRAITATSIGTDLSASTSAVVAGAVRAADMTAFLTQLAAAAEAIRKRDCPTISHGTGVCGCTAATEGAVMVALFDTDKNCAISLNDLETNQALTNVLKPDVVLPDNSLAVSLGFRVHAVPATFTLP